MLIAALEEWPRHKNSTGRRLFVCLAWSSVFCGAQVTDNEAMIPGNPQQTINHRPGLTTPHKRQRDENPTLIINTK